MDHHIITEKQVLELTGLDQRNLRRLERERKFPRRLRNIDRQGAGKVTGGKVRWKREKVLQWIRQDQETMKGKVGQYIGIKGVELVEWSDSRVVFRAAPGLKFASGTHALTFVCSDGKIWNAVWNHRSELEQSQCIRGCPVCTWRMESDETILRATSPRDTRRSI